MNANGQTRSRGVRTARRLRHGWLPSTFTAAAMMVLAGGRSGAQVAASNPRDPLAISRTPAAEHLRREVARHVVAAASIAADGDSARAQKELQQAHALLDARKRDGTVPAAEIGFLTRLLAPRNGNDQPAAQPEYEKITGHVVSADSQVAVLDLHAGHGLYAGQAVEFFRQGVSISTLPIFFVNQAQGQSAVKLDGGPLLREGDTVVYRRRRPSPDPGHPANALVGQRANVVLNFLPGDPSGRTYTMRVLEATVDASGGITSVLLGDDGQPTTLRRYGARHLDSLVTAGEAFTFDPRSGLLLTRAEQAAQASWNAELALVAREAELQRKGAEARRLAKAAPRQRAAAPPAPTRRSPSFAIAPPPGNGMQPINNDQTKQALRVLIVGAMAATAAAALHQSVSPEPTESPISWSHLAESERCSNCGDDTRGNTYRGTRSGFPFDYKCYLCQKCYSER